METKGGKGELPLEAIRESHRPYRN